MSDQDTDGSSALPKAGDVLAGIGEEERASAPSISQPEADYLRRFRSVSIEAETAYVHLQGARDHYWHKSKWSWFLMAAVGGMLVFQSVLLWKVGLGQLDFTEYEWLLPALLVQNLGQVIGLAVYAVKFLFSDITGGRAK